MQPESDDLTRTIPGDRALVPHRENDSRRRPVGRSGRSGIVRSLTALLAVASFTIAAAGPASAAQGGRDRPLKGSGSGVGTVTIVDGVTRITIEGTQHLTHLGRSTYRVDIVCINAACTGTGINVAANGDTYTTSFFPDGQGVEIITGGTGRFEGATGRQVSTGTTVFDPTIPLQFTNTFESTGTISY